MVDQPKVVSMRGGEILPPGEPRPNVIALCEDLLERAKSGDLMALSVAMYHSDDTHCHRHEGRAVYGTIGNIECLKTVVVKMVCE